MRLIVLALALTACQPPPAAKTAWEPIARVRIQDEEGAPLVGCRVQVVGEGLYPAIWSYRILHGELRTDGAGILSFDAAESRGFIFLVEERSGLVTALGPFERSWLFTGERSIGLLPLHELTGIVQDSTGEPLAGALVAPFTADIPHIYWGPLAPPGSRLESMDEILAPIPSGTRAGGWAQSVLGFTTTGDDGFFRLNTRIEKPALCVFNSEGLPMQMDLPWPEPEETPIYRLPELRMQEVLVQDPAGAPIAGAEVSVARETWNGWGLFAAVGLTDERGKVRATATGRQGWEPEDVVEAGVIVLGPAGFCDEWDSYYGIREPGPIRLDRAFPLKVRARDHGGRPISNCRFEALTWPHSPIGGTYPPRGDPIKGIKELEAGLYLMPGLRSNRELILVFHEGFVFDWAEIERDTWGNLIFDAEGFATASAELAPPAGASISLHDPETGAPLRGICFDLMPRSEPISERLGPCACEAEWNPQPQGFTDAQGRWTSPEVCAVRYVAVSITHPNGSRMVLPLKSLRRGSRIPFRSEMRTLDGAVTRSGQPLTDHWIRFSRSSADGVHEEFDCQSNAQGEYSIQLPTPDQYDVMVSATSDFSTGTYEVLRGLFLDREKLDIKLE